MYDVIIRSGRIVDGTGAPGYQADLAIRAGKIARIGDLSCEKAAREIDAAGLIVAPGFIDSHAHSDTSFLRDSSGASKLYQGITTEITGQCGSSPFPAAENRFSSDRFEARSFADFVEQFESSACMAVNQVILVGHGSLRAAVLGYADRAASSGEMELMKRLLRRDLEAGAWGLSLGLEYAPGFFAQAEELQSLGAVVREFDGLVPCHLRSEGLQIEAAIDELLSVGRKSGVHVHISHLKIDNYTVHGRAAQVWEKIEKARHEDILVTADVYPFTASCTSLSIRCPKWSQEGGSEQVVRHLCGPRRAEVVEGIRRHYFSADRAETCLINDDAGFWPQIVGHTLRDIAENQLHTGDYAEAAAEILVRTRGQAGGIFFVMNEDDMLYFLQKDVGIGSDGYALPGDPEKVPFTPHPRSYAAIAEFFRLAREKKLCSLEQAVRRVTSQAADMIGLTDRGRLKPGLIADITVFDPVRFAPRATYLQPVRLAAGVEHVLIHGELALTDGTQTSLRAGKFLRKTR